MTRKNEKRMFVLMHRDFRDYGGTIADVSYDKKLLKEVADQNNNEPSNQRYYIEECIIENKEAVMAKYKNHFCRHLWKKVESVVGKKRYLVNWRCGKCNRTETPFMKRKSLLKFGMWRKKDETKESLRVLLR